MTVHSQCTACTHLDQAAETMRCDAFPDGIPIEITHNRFDHHNPYPGDQGVLFELAVIPTDQKATA